MLKPFLQLFIAQKTLDKFFCPLTLAKIGLNLAKKLLCLAGIFFLILIVLEPKLIFLTLPDLLSFTNTLNFLTSPREGLFNLTVLPLYFAIVIFYITFYLGLEYKYVLAKFLYHHLKTKLNLLGHPS